MKRSPRLLTSTAPSPRRASVASGIGSRSSRNGRGMELNELEIAQDRPCAGRQRQPAALALRGLVVCA